MSDKILQNVISQFNDIIDKSIGMIDGNGIVMACNDPSKIGEQHLNVVEQISVGIGTYISGGYTYKAIGNKTKPEYIIFVSGEDDETEKMSKIIAVSISNIKNFCNEKYDRASFIRNVVMDNILPSDIYTKSKELHFDNNIERTVYLIKFNAKSEISPLDVIQSMFSNKNKDFVIRIGEKDIVLVKEIEENGDDENSPEYIAKTIVDTINGEFFTKVMIGIGTKVNTIKDLARSFKEAQVAIEVGKVFENEKYVVSYDNLGIGRLIYQLPTTLCEIFLEEVFKIGSLETLDRESLVTIQSFFENNLNVSETSRKLFVHRNTLVYRLEKIKKLTGLDLREFEHAITFKVALMVKKYLSSKPVKY